MIRLDSRQSGAAEGEFPVPVGVNWLSLNSPKIDSYHSCYLSILLFARSHPLASTALFGVGVAVANVVNSQRQQPGTSLRSCILFGNFIDGQSVTFPCSASHMSERVYVCNLRARVGACAPDRPVVSQAAGEGTNERTNERAGE